MWNARSTQDRISEIRTDLEERGFTAIAVVSCGEMIVMTATPPPRRKAGERVVTIYARKVVEEIK